MSGLTLTTSLSVARRALAEADTLPAISSLIDKAEIVRVAARKAELSLEAQNDWAEFKLDAERRAGEMLREMEKNPGTRPSLKDGGTMSEPPSIPKLSDLGIDKHQSSNWQKIAYLPEKQYQGYLEQQRKTGDEITETGMLKLAKELEQKSRQKNLKPAELPKGFFNVILADPPWQYENSATRASSEDHYPSMSLEEISKIKLPVTHDAALFLWATPPMIREALEIVDAWGFQYKTHAVWVKDKIGLGNYFRSQHELLLVALKGEMKCPAQENRPPSVFESPRENHSQKPNLVYALIEQMYPGMKYLELFARDNEERKGWNFWGNESR